MVPPVSESDTADPVTVELTDLFTASDVDQTDTPEIENIQITAALGSATTDTSLLSLSGKPGLSSEDKSDSKEILFLDDGGGGYHTRVVPWKRMTILKT